MASDFYLPYLLNYSQPAIEDIAIFCVAMLTAIIVSAEGQGFIATLLGDSQPGAKDRFHFNVFLHMSLLGTLNFFIAGFGWAKELQINPGNFKNHPRLFMVISRISGPLANLLMANIAASLNWILSRWGFDDKVFSTIVMVNITMAVYNLIIIAPLPGSAMLFALFPDTRVFEKMKDRITALGPYVIVGTFLLIRLSGWEGLSSLLNPVVTGLASIILVG